MTNRIDAETRSAVMSRIRSKDTVPEMMVRRLLHGRGLRYRLHVSGMPGTPDLVFPRHGAVIQVNGCFWHGHDCELFRLPTTNRDYWAAKIERNRTNDARAVIGLREQGWRVLVIWECALRGKSSLQTQEVADRVERWVRQGTGSGEVRGQLPSLAPATSQD
ncbi:MAG: DNA mismatch endonuclease Vsr [Thermoleophilia bacterium]|nr:DNA mismatch endonuclease Vsr [Thermoleophilia bacterium]